MRLIAVFLLWICCVVSSAAEISEADQLIMLANEVDVLRGDLRDKQDAWKHEEAGLLLLLQSLEDEKKRNNAQLALDKDTIATLQERRNLRMAAFEDYKQLRQTVLDFSLQLEQQLNDYLATSPLSLQALTQHNQNSQRQDSFTVLAEQLDRIKKQEQLARSINVRQISGILPDGKRRAVSALCIGGVAAYWLTDNSAGHIIINDGAYTLIPVQTNEPLKVIQTAFSILENNTQAQPVLLPRPPTTEVK